MNYTIDKDCCDNIEQYIRDQEEVVRKLEEIRSTWDTSDERSFDKLLKG